MNGFNDSLIEIAGYREDENLRGKQREYLVPILDLVHSKLFHGNVRARLRLVSLSRFEKYIPS